MSSLRPIFEVARRDFLQRGRSRVFLLGTLAVIVLIVGGGPLLANVASGASVIEVGVVGTPSTALTAAFEANAAAMDVRYELTAYASRAEAEDAVRSGAEAAVVDGASIVWLDQVSPITNALVSASLQEVQRMETVDAIGLTDEDIQGLFAVPESVLIEDPDPERGVRQGAAYAGAVVLFMSVVLFGQFVLLGVLEEKSSRVAEVVLSRVRPVELLAGKVIGIGLLGLLQLLALGGAILVAVQAVDIADLPDLANIGVRVVVTVVAWYVLGYTFYSVVYAAAGALVSRQEDVQGVSWIPMIGLFTAYFLSLIASWRPDAIEVRIASMFPGTAPMVMPVRASAGDVAPWEVLVAVAMTLVSAYLLIQLAARVYRGGILRGGRVRVRDAWRAQAH